MTPFEAFHGRKLDVKHLRAIGCVSYAHIAKNERRKLDPVAKCCILLKSVRVHFAYGRIALTLELLGRFGRFLDEDDRHSPPVLLVPFSRLLGL